MTQSSRGNARPPRKGRPPKVNREQVVAAAAEILSTAGPSAFSMRTLAAKLDISPMGIYHYFDSKNDLLGAVLEHQAWDTPDVELPDEPRERLVEIGVAVVDHLTAHSWVVDVLAANEALDTHTGRLFDDFFRTAATLGADHAACIDAAQGVWRIVLGEAIVRSGVAARAARNVPAWFDSDATPPAGAADMADLSATIPLYTAATAAYDVRRTLRDLLSAAIPGSDTDPSP
ncbi:TetR/AcrR family transcriptional regulator [Tsukamurella soli]|uniref:HTH tetR-type domain-containing protein n=1 Tax=Tsukamurella soli TaxID=644556 RepID=A0ABP8KDD4_9ACTN